MPTINDLKKKALNNAGYFGTLTQAEKAWLEEVCAPYKATIPEMWKYALKQKEFTGPLPEAQSKMMASLGHTGALPNKWYKYWSLTPTEGVGGLRGLNSRAISGRDGRILTGANGRT